MYTFSEEAKIPVLLFRDKGKALFDELIEGAQALGLEPVRNSKEDVMHFGERRPGTTEVIRGKVGFDGELVCRETVWRRTREPDGSLPHDGGRTGRRGARDHASGTWDVPYAPRSVDEVHQAASARLACLQRCPRAKGPVVRLGSDSLSGLDGRSITRTGGSSATSRSGPGRTDSSSCTWGRRE
jgi:hypothetical protein